MPKQLYTAKGIQINDSWYIRHNGRYYAYYLQYPVDAPEEGRWNQQSIGLSISENLLDWQYQGTVLKAEEGLWCDKGLATGSVVEKDGMAWLLYTGNGWAGKDGLGLAVSQDFIHFERYRSGPVIPREKPYRFPYRNGELLCSILADPYVYPEPVEGWYYVFINSRAVERPVGSRGCITVMRSRDLITYEPYGVALDSDVYDRLETPQIWRQSGQWVMYYGAVKSREENGAVRDYALENRLAFSSRIADGYSEVGSSALHLPDGTPFYIGKTVEISEKGALFIANVYPAGGYGPYWIDIQNGNVQIKE